RHHSTALSGIDADQLLALLDHADDEIQQFGASQLEKLAVDNWPIETWLRLLETRSLTALVTICQTMSQRVRPERLNVAQCVDLACARATPVARLGFDWLKQRKIASEADRKSIVNLANARCEVISDELAQFALSLLGEREVYQTKNVIAF